MLHLFKGPHDKNPPRQFSLALLKLIELEDLVNAVNKFYDRLPKLVAKRPAFDELLKTILYRVTYALMHPKVVGHFQNSLPIEEDCAGYFFAAHELKEARIKIEGAVASKTKDTVLQTLESILIDGLDIFRDFPAFRYLAAISASKKSRAFSEEMRGIVETMSLLAKDKMTAAGYISQVKEKTVGAEITAYEKNVLPRVKLSALLLYSLYFDLNNLFLGEFSDQSIEREIAVVLGEDFPKDSIGGLFPVLIDKRAYDKFKQKKINYLGQIRQTLEQRLYVPLALHLFRQNAALDSKLKPLPYKVFTELKVLEFLEYNQSGDYRGYVNCLNSSKDIRSLLSGPLKDLSREADHSEMIARYLKLFLSGSLPGRILNSLRTKQFIELWIQAYRCRWDKELASAIDIVPAIVNDSKLLEFLKQQKSGALVLMLKHTGFRDYLKRVDATALDFFPLYKVFCRNQALFDQLCARFPEDKKFVQVLAELLSQAEDVSGIIINDDLRSFVNSLGNYHPGDSKALIYLLKNFKAAELALDYGYTPFSAALAALEDKAAFAKWFFANHQSIAKKLALADTISPYLGEAKNPQLREALSELYEKHGDEFLKNLNDLKQWGHGQNLSHEALIKVVQFFTAQKHAKRLIKRREIVNLVQYMAENASSEKWQEFFTEFTRIDGSAITDYTAIFEKYQAAIILKAMQSETDMKKVRNIVGGFSG